MVIHKWLHSILTGRRPEVEQASTGHVFEEFKKKDKKSTSVDLANAAIIDNAENLDELIALGSSWIKRRKLKKQIRKKVQDVIADEFDDPEIIDEVTERIADAAEVDPFYKNLFCKDA